MVTPHYAVWSSLVVTLQRGEHTSDIAVTSFLKYRSHIYTLAEMIQYIGDENDTTLNRKCTSDVKQSTQYIGDVTIILDCDNYDKSKRAI